MVPMLVDCQYFSMYASVLLKHYWRLASFLVLLVLTFSMTASQAEVDQLKTELQKLRSDYAAHGSQGVSPAPPIYVASRKVERFKDRPEKSDDLTVEDWVADMKAHILARNYSGKAAAACIREHLAGKARLEIMGRGIDDDPDKILETLLRVFGDGDLLPQLQQKFYSYSQQQDEDLVACSLRLLQLFDRIATLDPAFKPCKKSLLKIGRAHV